MGQKKEIEKPSKPWGIKERVAVLTLFLSTVTVAGILAISARSWKLPNLPRVIFPSMEHIKNMNPFREQTIIIKNTGSDIDEDKIKKIKQDFREETNKYSGIYSFYIYDLNGDYFYGENYQEILQAASLIKLPVMELAFKKIEKGELDKESVLSLIELMGKKSDNNSFNKLVSMIGEDEIEREILNLGMAKTSLSENTTTAEDIGIFFQKLYKNELIGEENKNLFFDYLTDTNFEDWLRKGIPEDIKVSHKYARETHSVSDAGVVFHFKPFVLVIMTDGVVETEADQVFPFLSKMLYDGHVGDN